MSKFHLFFYTLIFLDACVADLMACFVLVLQRCETSGPPVLEEGEDHRGRRADNDHRMELNTSRGY